jgi:hypothetical protein
MERKRTSLPFRLVAMLAMSSASCVHPPEDIAMPQNSPSRTAAASPHELGDKLLALIDNIRSRDDLAAEHIERVTGLKLDPEADTVYLYGTGGEVADGWRYRLGAMAGDEDRASGLLFSFDHPEGEGADRAPVCDPDFESYRNALQQKGFDSRQIAGSRGGTRFWEFSREGVTVRIRTIGESDARPDHACVSTISILA